MTLTTRRDGGTLPILLIPAAFWRHHRRRRGGTRRKVSVVNFGWDNFNFRFYRKLVSSADGMALFSKVRRLCDEAYLIPTNHFYRSIQLIFRLRCKSRVLSNIYSDRLKWRNNRQSINMRNYVLTINPGKSS